MLGHYRPAASEPVDRVAVVVTFMRMDQPPASLETDLPPGVSVCEERLNVPAYRKLYHEIGAPWLWWLRRVMTDGELARHLSNPKVSTYILREDGEVAGFFETDASPWPDINLNYFGLMPGKIGKGLGRLMLHTAIASVFADASKLRGMTVNTCTADHPRALPNYLAAGFVKIRQVREIWDIPRALGFVVPEHLRA